MYWPRIAGIVATLIVLTRTASAQNVRGREYAWMRQVPKEFRVEIVSRMVSGRFVIDKERVHGAPQAPPFDPVAIYEVRRGLITNVWFLEPK
jgi:hypothetical protein